VAEATVVGTDNNQLKSAAEETAAAATATATATTINSKRLGKNIQGRRL
jgi:hypothetical protein